MAAITEEQRNTRDHLCEVNKDCQSVEQFLGEQQPKAQLVLRFDTGGIPKVFLIYINGHYEPMEPWP